MENEGFRSEREILTIEIVKKFMEDEDSVDLWEYTKLNDDAAQILADYEGGLDLQDDLQSKVESFKNG